MTNNLPRYRALAEEIRRDYLGGSARPGDRLPPETEFCRHFGVARGTVIKAIELLVAEGVLVRRQGAGTFVADPGLRRRQGPLQSFTQSMGALEREIVHQVLSIERLSDEAARSFGSTEPMMRLTRLRMIDHLPVALHVSSIPESLFNTVLEANREALVPGVRASFSLYAAFDFAGQPVIRARESNFARLATPEEARLLSATTPVAVMEVWRTSFGATGRLLDATRAIYLSGNYSVDIELARPPAGE